MGRTELPWLLWGRYLRPFSLALSLACLAIGWGTLSGATQQPGLTDTTMGALIAVGAVLATALLWAGWWMHGHNPWADAAMEHGLIIAAGVWVARAVTVAVALGGINEGVILSLCWAFAAGSAWLLERTTGGDGGRPGER
jgi:hypothetical protein